MAFIGYNEIEILNRDVRVVIDCSFLFCLFWFLSRFFPWKSVQRSKADSSSNSGSSSFSPLSIEYRRWIVVMHTLQTGSKLFDFRCCTLYTFVNNRPSRNWIAIKLPQRLLSKVIFVNQKEHSFCFWKLDQPVNKTHSVIRFSAACRHLDQGSWPVVCQ